MKKPFYKKWWFITIVVLLVLATIGNALPETQTVEKTVKGEPKIEAVVEPEDEAVIEEVTEEDDEQSSEPAEENKSVAAEPKKEDANVTAKVESVESTLTVWEQTIAGLVANDDGAPDKFYALEKFMMTYTATKEEVEQFSKDIIADYQSGIYLSEINNHERMLTNIFKAYVVDQQAKEPMKELAFDYGQIIKYTYRGAEAVDSNFVKENEYQIEKALQEL